MIDVAIRLAQAPKFGVDVGASRHVFVNQHLKIDALGSICADHQVGADAQVRGHIAKRVAKPSIRSVLSFMMPSSLTRGVH